MSWLYRHLARPVLFTQKPEDIHNRTMGMLGFAARHRLLLDAMEALFGAPQLNAELMGLKFPNPIGLAAGMDKKAEATNAWQAMGFGFTELGAVTWHPQPGNPAPRVFRAIADEAIVNRMGFNNPGAQEVARTIEGCRSAGRWPAHPVGINLGKSKIAPLSEAPGDYANSFRVLWPHLDFFVVNVSSPNTPNLRQLQDRAALEDILLAMQDVQENHMAAKPGAVRKPILVKVAPDLSWEALDEILELAVSGRIAGLVATNTTITRPDSANEHLKSVYAEAGGLSGKPLRQRSTDVIRHLYRQSAGKMPIIGVGGVFNAEDAWEKIAAGASLIQIYTSLVFEGPGVARSIVTGLLEKLSASGMKSLAEAVGTQKTA